MPVKHFTDEFLLDLAMAEIGSLDRARPSGEPPAQHLQGCAVCRKRWAELREAVWSLEFASGEPDPAWIENIIVEAKRAAGLSEANERRLSQRLKEVFDRTVRELGAIAILRPAAAPAGIRGAKAPTVSLFESREFSVSLSTSAVEQSARFRIVGNVVPRIEPDLPAGGRAYLYGAAGIRTSAIDNMGEFAFQDIPAGDFHLDLDFGEGHRLQVSPVHAKPVDAGRS